MKILFLIFTLLISNTLANTIKFYDQVNNEVVLKDVAKKVVTIPIPLASLSITIDEGTSRLVSINPIAKEAINKGILGTIFPKRIELSTQGIGDSFMPNIEELLQLNPDIIFQWSHRGETIVAPLKNAGLNIALLKYGKEEYTQKWFNMLGKAYGKEKRVEEILSHRKAIQKKIQELTKQIDKKDKPKALYFLRFYSGLKVAGINTFNHYSINLSGGKNIPNITNFKDVGVEEILKYDPEIIFLNNFEPKLSPKDIYNHPLLSLTKAAKNKQVYKMPLGGTRWDPPGQESPLLWLWLFKLMHPALVDFNLKDEIKKAYKLLYNYDLDEKEMYQILKFNMNKNSKYYKEIL